MIYEHKTDDPEVRFNVKTARKLIEATPKEDFELELTDGLLTNAPWLLIL